MTPVREKVTARNDYALRAITSPRFRGRLIEKIVDAIEDVNDDKADILLLAARRMSSLYALLRTTGLPELTREDTCIISDRFIGLLPDEAWAGQRVILLDDTRDTGETARIRKDKAQRLVGSTGTIDVRVGVDFAVDKDADREDLHNQFATAFGTNLIPFFTDFAVSAEFEVSATDLDRLLASADWRTVDVTNSVLAGTGARSFSLFPIDGFREKVLGAISDASSIAEVVKVRLFVYNDFGRFRMRFVPIVLLSDLSESSLQAVATAAGYPSATSEGALAATSGLCAFALSRAVFAVFAAHLDRVFGIASSEDVEMASIALGSECHRIANEKVPMLLPLLAPAGEATVVGDARFVWPGQGDDGEHFVIAGDDLIRHSYELLAELKAHKTPDKLWLDSARSLAEMASANGGSATTLSLSLDVLNDLGYCVPAQTVRDGRAMRVYRPGEVIPPFGDLRVGTFGARLASRVETLVVPDETYYGEEILRSSRGLE